MAISAAPSLRREGVEAKMRVGSRLAVGAVCVVLAATACGEAPSGVGRSDEKTADAVGVQERAGGLPEAIGHVASEHLARLAPARHPALVGASLGEHARAIDEPGMPSPAYWEVPFVRAGVTVGYAVVRAGDAPRVVEFGERGPGPASRLAQREGAVRFHRLDTAVYVGEDAAGRVVGPRGLARIDRASGEARLVAETPARALAAHAGLRADAARRAASDATRAQGFWDYFWDPGPPAGACTAPGPVPAYVQIDAGAGPNTSSCLSGCGPTAWAMIFGWASKRASVEPSAAVFAPLVREGGSEQGAVVVAPDGQDGTIENLTWSLRENVGTFCLNGQGASTPWDMGGAARVAAARAGGVAVDVDYSSLMVEQGRLRDVAMATICDGRPVILGIGTMWAADMHYPVASAYEDGWFWLNMGWGGGGDAWYWTGTWFAGTVRAE